jgi:hypothetical protein
MGYYSPFETISSSGHSEGSKQTQYFFFSVNKSWRKVKKFFWVAAGAGVGAGAAVLRDDTEFTLHSKEPLFWEERRLRWWTAQ